SALSGAEYSSLESEHSAVAPCIGALADWYLLIVSKRHTHSVGWLDEAEHADLRELTPQVTGLIRERSGLESLIFEHGSLDFRDKCGACYDHTHIHVVATARDHPRFLDHIPAPVPTRPCADWTSASRRLADAAQRP